MMNPITKIYEVQIRFIGSSVQLLEEEPKTILGISAKNVSPQI